MVRPDQCAPSFKKYKSTLASACLFEILNLVWSLGFISWLPSQTRCAILETLGKYKHPLVPLFRVVQPQWASWLFSLWLLRLVLSPKKKKFFSFRLCPVLKNGQTWASHSISFTMSSPTSIWWFREIWNLTYVFINLFSICLIKRHLWCLVNYRLQHVELIDWPLKFT